MALVRTIWKPLISLNEQLGLALILLFGGSRFFLVMHATVSGDNTYVSLIFLLMIGSPFILLARKGRKAIGLKMPNSYFRLGICFFVGMGISLGVFALGVWLYQTTSNNWFVYIGNTNGVEFTTLTLLEKRISFTIFALISMTLSPLGEEFLYRGLIHESLATNWGKQTASILDSAAFAFTHLAHFGWVFIAGKWKFLPLPALCWIGLMFGTGWVFSYCREMVNSIWGAVVCHAGFNLAMTWVIFYMI